MTHTHAIRSKALMAREIHSWPEKVTHTYIYHAQCYHIEQESKIDIAIPRECGLSKEQEKERVQGEWEP